MDTANKKINLKHITHFFRAEHPTWIGDLDVPAIIHSFIEEARIHCLQPLLYHQFHKAAEWVSWPRSVQEVFMKEYQMQVVSEAVRQAEVQEVLSKFEDEGIGAITLKGTALGYSVYPESCLRPRGDTDLLISKKDVNLAKDIMLGLGYEFDNMIPGELINHQMMAAKRDAMGIAHVFDIHWKLSNPKPFSELLPYQECKEHSEQIRIGSQKVHILSPEYALLYACIHRVAHHYNDQKLIWLYDIHLLSEKLGQEGLLRFSKLAHRKKTTRICKESLELASEHFGTKYVQECFRDLPSETDEVTASYLKMPPRRIHGMLSDFWALRSWGDRLQWVGEHVFPPSDYMMRKYGVSSKIALPWLYLWRIVRGFGKLFRKLN